MASGHARVIHEATGKRVKILDVFDRPRWSEMWDGLSWIAQPRERGDFVTIRNGPQCRPYIRYPFSRVIGQQFTGWRARDHIGAIEFRPHEIRTADRALGALRDKPFVVLEPNLSGKGNPNKQWGESKWQRLADSLVADGISVAQFGAPGIRMKLRGVARVVTPTFRVAAAALLRANAAVLPEGGLHHAAGVLGVPAVVLFGGMISPETTGYPHHTNIAADGEPCGKWRRCGHCVVIWSQLQVHEVASALRALLQKEEAKWPEQNSLPILPTASAVVSASGLRPAANTP